jgi:hypothetical protein
MGSLFRGAAVADGERSSGKVACFRPAARPPGAGLTGSAAPGPISILLELPASSI